TSGDPNNSKPGGNGSGTRRSPRGPSRVGKRPCRRGGFRRESWQKLLGPQADRFKVFACGCLLATKEFLIFSPPNKVGSIKPLLPISTGRNFKGLVPLARWPDGNHLSRLNRC